MNNREFEFWLRRATREQKLNALLRNQRSMMHAQELEIELELQQMADFTKLNAKVAGIKDIATSLNTMFTGVVAERDNLKKELAELKAADAVDQEAVDAAEAAVADAQHTIEALQAVAAGTPIVLPPDPGGSTAGITG